MIGRGKGEGLGWLLEPKRSGDRRPRIASPATAIARSDIVLLTGRTDPKEAASRPLGQPLTTAMDGNVHYKSEVTMYLVWQHRKNSPKSRSHALAMRSLPADQDALEQEGRALPYMKSMRPHSRPRPKPPSPSLVAVVVESNRVDGKPRQSLLQYLGSIQCSEITALSARRHFWIRAAAALGEFDQETRQKLEQALEAKVRRPTAEEVAATSPAAIRARFDAGRAARAAERSIEVQGPIKPSTVPAPATRTDLGGEKTQVKDQAEVATGTSAGPS